MSGQGRFESMLRWYPPSWRQRYGDELAALLEDTHGMAHVPLRARLDVVRSGAAERARVAGIIGTSQGPGDRVRAGSLLILCAWSLFVVSGAVFAKFADRWDAGTPRALRHVPGAGFDAVQWAAIVGGVTVLAAAVIVVPAFVRLLHEGGWSRVRRPVLRALTAVSVAAAVTGGVVLWAHQIGAHDRNGGSIPYSVAFVLWSVVVVAALATCTVAAVSVARQLTLSGRMVRGLGVMALGLDLVMMVLVAGVVTWWVALAIDAPGVLGNGVGATSDVVPPTLVGAGVVMVLGLSLAAVGTVGVVRSLRTTAR